MATQQTLTLYPSGYLSDYKAASVSNLTNGYTDSSSATYAQIDLTTGANAETYIYYTFDTSSIPSHAVITNVSCIVKASISNTLSSYIKYRTAKLYSGTTQKGTALNLSSSAYAQSISGTISFTRNELNNVYLQLYSQRGTSATSNSYYIRFYGATLTISYIVPDITVIPVKGNSIISGVSKETSSGKVIIGGSQKNIKESYSFINGVWEPCFETVTEDILIHRWKKYSRQVSEYEWELFESPDAVISAFYSDSVDDIYSDSDLENAESNSPYMPIYKTVNFDKTTGTISVTNVQLNDAGNALLETTYSNIKQTIYKNNLPYVVLVDSSDMTQIPGGYSTCVTTDSVWASNDDTNYFMLQSYMVFCVRVETSDSSYLRIWRARMKKKASKYTIGTYIEDVTSFSADAYPNNATQGSYWYVYQGSEILQS